MEILSNYALKAFNYKSRVNFAAKNIKQIDGKNGIDFDGYLNLSDLELGQFLKLLAVDICDSFKTQDDLLLSCNVLLGKSLEEQFEKNNADNINFEFRLKGTNADIREDKVNLKISFNNKSLPGFHKLLLNTSNKLQTTLKYDELQISDLRNAPRLGSVFDYYEENAKIIRNIADSFKDPLCIDSLLFVASAFLIVEHMNNLLFKDFNTSMVLNKDSKRNIDISINKRAFAYDMVSQPTRIQ